MVDSLKVIVTGVTGMVGEGVLNECLADSRISDILVINRKPCGVSHHKLKEILHQDFFDLSTISTQLSGYNACLFCLGVSSVGMKETEYTHLTFDLTMNFAQTLVDINSQMTFCYISGASTDSTEKGRIMWARVKGKTENSLMKLLFKNVYNFRPAILTPTRGLKNTLKFYKYLGWLIPFFKLLMPNSICSLKQLGIAMINVVRNDFPKHILEVKDIIAVASGPEGNITE